MVAMRHMFPDMLQPKIRLSGSYLVLTSHFLAVAQLFAKMAQIQIDRFQGADLLCSILENAAHACFGFRLLYLQLFHPDAQSRVFLCELLDSSGVAGNISPAADNQILEFCQANGDRLSLPLKIFLSLAFGEPHEL